MRKQVLALTDTAAARILQLLQHQQKPFLRLAVEAKGCNMISIMCPEVFYLALAAMIFVFRGERCKDPCGSEGGIMHVIGTEMDFVDDKLRVVETNTVGTEDELSALPKQDEDARGKSTRRRQHST
ncbi:HesB-like domain superfamily [Arabidopsis suecica]|uniref:HesB-like domain superfamily n=1 Tax=Arabidopsis suecica TaxID=45249 RepID=A0A8T2ALH9_ARASU|nr:HesB-like domain superfamily [Arabidopsis suecica]